MAGTPQPVDREIELARLRLAHASVELALGRGPGLFDQHESDAVYRAALMDFRKKGGGDEVVAALTERKRKIAPLRDGVETWLDALRTGEFKGYGSGTGLSVTEKVIDELVESVNASEQPIPIDGAQVSEVHEMPGDSGAMAAGWILEATKLKDAEGRPHFWVRAMLHPAVAPKIAGEFVLYGSVAYRPFELDPETGERSARLHSYALTNKPFIPGLAPHALRDKPGDDRIAASDNRGPVHRPTEAPMTEKKDEKTVKATEGTGGDDDKLKAAEKSGRMKALREVLGSAAEGKSDEDVEDMFKRRGETKADADGAVAASADKRPDAKDPTERIGAVETELKALTEARNLEAAQHRVDTLAKDKGVKLADPHRDLLVQAQLKGQEQVVANFIEAEVARLPKAGEALAGNGGRTSTGGSYDEVLGKLVKELGEKNPKASRSEIVSLANREIAARHPDLVPEIYRRPAA